MGGLLTPRLRPDGKMTGKMSGLGKIFYCPNYSVGQWACQCAGTAAGLVDSTKAPNDGKG